MPGRIAGETERRRRPPRLRPRPADARAAHPPREGDPQHLHRAGAERARRRWSTSPGSAARASASSASCWSGAPPTRASAWPRSTGSSCCTRRRSRASSRSALDAPVDRGARALRRARHRRRLPARPRLPRVRGRPAGRDHRAPHASAQIDELAEALGAAIGRRGTVAERSEAPHEAALMAIDRDADAARTRRGRSTRSRSRAAAPRCCPTPKCPEPPLEELIPAKLLRAEPPRLPEVAEPEIVRHYNRLSRRNFDLDTGFYPLGSCTMKHNPRLNERVAALPGHARLHPAQDPQPRPGGAGADVAAAGVARRDLRPAPRQPAALGRLPRRARRPAADPRLPRRPRRRADQGAGARHLARHQPGLGDDGRLRGGQGRDQRARRGRDGRPAGEDRRADRSPA